MVEYNDNVGIAFAVVTAAGLSTAVGASVVFFPKLIQYANRKTLAGSLGISAGVMTYVSFVEIFQKSVDSFSQADFLDEQAYLAATLCFFAGIIMMMCLNLLIHGVAEHNLIANGRYLDSDDDESQAEEDVSDVDSTSSQGKAEVENESNDTAIQDHNIHHHTKTELDDHIPGPSPCCNTGKEGDEQGSDEGISNTDLLDSESCDPEAGTCTSETAARKANKKKERKTKDQRTLIVMSLKTVMAIALHNFPEGLATFVATLQDPAVGAVLALAIATHNIPEGLCVAMPVYYATGNRWRAFGWGLLSGLSEPLAALLGWIVLASWVNDIVFAVLFGIVAGMMVVISVKELLPTAHRYDPEDKCVTNMFIVGMAIMATSMALFAHI